MPVVYPSRIPYAKIFSAELRLKHGQTLFVDSDRLGVRWSNAVWYRAKLMIPHCHLDTVAKALKPYGEFEVKPVIARDGFHRIPTEAIRVYGVRTASRKP